MTDVAHAQMTPAHSASTASEVVRSAPTVALRVTARELEIYDQGYVEGVDEVFSPDLIDHNPIPGAASAVEGFRELVTAVRDGFSETQHRILFHEEMPGGWVVLHWQMSAIHTGDAFGVPASNNPVCINGTDIFRVEGGKIVEISHVEENQKLFAQMSASPSDS